MDDSKTYVFDTARNSLDPNALLAMMNNNGGMNGNNWLWVIFLFFLYGWGNRGIFGNNGQGGLGNEINNDYGRSLLLQAINGNGQAISQLASTLNCDINSIRTAIDSINQSICNVGNQVGMSTQQVTNAIQSGNSALQAQLAQCCCDMKLLVSNQSYENQIAIANQTTALTNKIDQQTNLINDKFCQLEMREMQNKINTLTEEKSTLQGIISNNQQTANLQQYVTNSVTPINMALNALQAEIASIKCGLPPTVNVPYSPVVGIPTCVAAQYGIGRWVLPTSDTGTTTPTA